MRLKELWIEWLPALGGMLCMGFSVGILGLYGFFTPHLAAEFDVGVAVINIGPIVLILMPGLMGPIAGKLVDRFPIHRLMYAGSFIALCGLLIASQAPSLMIAFIAFVCFALGIPLYGPVTVNGMLVKLYPEREARALAIAAMGVSFASILLPPLVGKLLSTMDWRQALMTLAIGMFVLQAIVITGGIPKQVLPPEHAEESQREFPVDDKNFWLIGLAMAMGLCGTLTLVICYPPHFAAAGFTVAQAAIFISVSGVAGMVGKLSLAVLADQFAHHAKWLATVLLIMLASGVLLLAQAQNFSGVVPAMAILGFASGAFLPMQAYLNSQYFDASHIGRVTGGQMPMFLPFGVAGPPLAGYMFDISGHYIGVLMVVATTIGTAALLTAALPNRSRRAQSH